jgi:DNA-binding CsgD family transcriptional regulator
MPRKAGQSYFVSSYKKLGNDLAATARVNTENVTQDELFSPSEWSEIVNDLGISQRQADVIWELLQGRSDKQIARQLGLSVGTVRTHLDRLFLRFGMQDRSELIIHVFHHLRRKCKLIRCPLFNLYNSI